MNNYTCVYGLKEFFFSASDIDDCYPSPCENNGTCIDGVTNYTCACVPGFEGKNCSIGKFFSKIKKKIQFISQWERFSGDVVIKIKLDQKSRFDRLT